MLNREKSMGLLKRFKSDERGNMSLMFAVSAVAVIGCMGAAMDFSTLSSAHKRSQSIADTTALNAAIFVKNNDREPKTNDEGYVAGEHTAADLGFEYKGWVDGGAQNVTVDVVYDDANKEARVTVSGKTVPTFMQVLGRTSMNFKAESTVSYLNVDESHPASITLVLDNSGSMRWDDTKRLETGERPANPKARIEGLKTSVKTFRDDLNSRLGDLNAADGHQILRTGILPYNSEIKSWTNGATTGMQWRYDGVSDSHVDNMVAAGGTNSNPPMAEAKNWLDAEDDAHRTEASRVGEDYREPLKFVVFMTDGQNTAGEIEFVEDQTTGIWYRPAPPASNGRKRWYYSYWPRNDYTEGKLQLDSDRKTIESCLAMKAEGIKIYTIGFALEVGEYWDPLYSSYEEVTEGTAHTAHALLTSCASDEHSFIMASDGKELDGAFDQIQNSIIKELIRVKS